MGLTVRHYLFADDGAKRLSHRLVNGLVLGRDAMPQYASTKQKIARVVIESTDGKPVKILEASGSYFAFDEAGKVRDSLQKAAWEGLDTFLELEKSLRQKRSGTVVSIAPTLKRQRWERENCWEPTREHLDLIAADIWNRGKTEAPAIEQAKGTAAVRPPLTRDARNALQEIESKLADIRFGLDDLSETALKSLAFEARARGEEAHGNPLMLAVAAEADKRREIIARRRTGKGPWFAVVEAVTWNDDLRRTGSTLTLAEEKCVSQAEAEAAAKRLLVEHAQRVSARTSVEARVLSELEWPED